MERIHKDHLKNEDFSEICFRIGLKVDGADWEGFTVAELAMLKGALTGFYTPGLAQLRLFCDAALQWAAHNPDKVMT